MAWEFLAAIFGAAFIAGGNAKAKQHQQELMDLQKSLKEGDDSRRQRYAPDRALEVRVRYHLTMPDTKEAALAQAIDLCPTFASLYPYMREDEYALNEHITAIILAKYGKITERRLRKGFVFCFESNDSERAFIAKLYRRFMQEYQELIWKTHYVTMLFFPRCHPHPLSGYPDYKHSHYYTVHSLTPLISFYSGTYVFSTGAELGRGGGFVRDIFFGFKDGEIKKYCYDENHNLIPI